MPEAPQTGPPDLAPLLRRPRTRRRAAPLRVLVRLSAGIMAAGIRKAYGSQAQAVSSSEAPDGMTQVVWTAPDLGDQALGETWYGAPAADEAIVSVWVQSGNADISLSRRIHWNRSASEYSAELPVMAMARNVLTALVKHAG